VPTPTCFFLYAIHDIPICSPSGTRTVGSPRRPARNIPVYVAYLPSTPRYSHKLPMHGRLCYGASLPAVAFCLIYIALCRDKTRKQYENTSYRTNSLSNSAQIQRRNNRMVSAREMAAYSPSPSQMFMQRKETTACLLIWAQAQLVAPLES